METDRKLPCFVLGIDYIDGSHTEEDKGWQKIKKAYRDGISKTTGIATGALVGGGLIRGLVGYNVNKEGKVAGTGGHKGAGGEPAAVSNRGLMYFTNMAEFNVLSQAVERIFPEDDLGPGAIALGAPFFIDNQLAGNYGSNVKEYMQGPFFAGESTQGYQSKLTRAEIFRQGIAKMDEEAKISDSKKGLSISRVSKWMKSLPHSKKMK